MPPTRLSYRRRSSLAIPTSSHIKPGIYGAPSPSPRSVTFAPNVTPVTFNDPSSLDTFAADPDSSTLHLFPPSDSPAPPQARRRVPPGKRRSLGYIPRPPNAFMLFRADFVRQKHVPGSIETNHGSLSKIIGNCWRALPLEEKRVWEIRAKKAKEEHAAMYPGYRFRPVHNKDKAKKKTKAPATPQDEQRCEAVAQLLLEGKKGDELAAAIRRLDDRTDQTALPPAGYPFRRPSSVPLPEGPFHPIALPAIPFLQVGSRAGSPVGNISRSARFVLGHRRPSSVQPIPSRPWGTLDPMAPLHHDMSSLPEVDSTLFDPAFLDSGFSFQLHMEPSLHLDEIYPVPPHASSPGEYPQVGLVELSPKDATAFPITSSDASPLPQYTSMALSSEPVAMSMPNSIPMSMSLSGIDMDPLAWLGSSPTDIADIADFAHSQPSSAYSGSPATSDVSLPTVVAPTPQQPDAHVFEGWQDVVGNGPVELATQDQVEMQQSQHFQDGFSTLLFPNEFEGGAYEYMATQAF
ncbi:hypothetical protein EDC04DRAFT_2716412 [Pisolithus marmoratus]|nr:hypothetical protein EDC04DRAFT_2716412 [Pisolithus marmoratus]